MTGGLTTSPVRRTVRSQLNITKTLAVAVIEFESIEEERIGTRTSRRFGMEGTIME